MFGGAAVLRKYHVRYFRADLFPLTSYSRCSGNTVAGGRVTLHNVESVLDRGGLL